MLKRLVGLLYAAMMYMSCRIVCLVLLCAIVLSAKEEGRINVDSLRISVLGPLDRDHISMKILTESTLEVGGCDLFHFSLLHGDPLEGHYDWFKIARAEDSSDWYLVLGSDDGSKEWVEKGEMLHDRVSGVMKFILRRVDGVEGQRQKIIRQIEWREEQKSSLLITLWDYRRLFVNPDWGKPMILRVQVDIRGREQYDDGHGGAAPQDINGLFGR